MAYIEKPILILNLSEQVLGSKSTLLVKVLWQRHSIKKVTWELQVKIREKYPHIFDSWGMFFWRPDFIKMGGCKTSSDPDLFGLEFRNNLTRAENIKFNHEKLYMHKLIYGFLLSWSYN